MSRQLFNHLKTQDLERHNVFENIFSFTEEKIRKILIGCIETINDFDIRNQPKNIHDLQFTPSFEFTGDSSTCQNPECIEITATNLLRFSCLYSDKIFIWSPFEKHLVDGSISKFQKFCIANDIRTILIYKEVILAGFIEIVKFDSFHFCSDCYSQYVEQHHTSYDNLRNELFKRVKNLYKEKCQYFIGDNIGNGFGSLNVETKEEKYLIHKPITSQFEITSSPHLLKAVKRKSKRIYRNELEKFEGFTGHIDSIVSKIINQNFLSEVTNSHFLTNNEVDMEIVSNFNQQIDNKKHFDLQNSLSHSLPFLNDLPVSAIIELREKDGESFKNYRYEIQHLYKNANDLNQSELKEYFSDIIRPKLNSIDLTINTFKKTRRKSIIHNAVAAGAYLYAGSFGLFESTFANSLSALGGFNHGVKFQNNILNSEPKEIRNEKFYFLWKLTNGNPASNKR